MQATAGIVVDGRADAWTVVVIDSQQRTSESPLAWQSLGPDGETYAAMPSERMLWVAMDMDIETMNDKNYVNNKLAYALSKYLEDMGQCHAERMLYCPANAFAEIEDVSDLGTYETNARIIDIPHYITTDDLVHLNCVLARYPLCGHIIAAGLGHVLLHQQIPPDCEYLMHLDISKGGPYVDQLAWLLRALWNVGLTLEAANTLDVTVVTRRNGMYHVLIHGDGLTTISEDDGVLVPPLASLTPYSAQNEDAWTHILNVVPSNGTSHAVIFRTHLNGVKAIHTFVPGHFWFYTLPRAADITIPVCASTLMAESVITLEDEGGKLAVRLERNPSRGATCYTAPDQQFFIDAALSVSVGTQYMTAGTFMALMDTHIANASPPDTIGRLLAWGVRQLGVQIAGIFDANLHVPYSMWCARALRWNRSTIDIDTWMGAIMHAAYVVGVTIAGGGERCEIELTEDFKFFTSGSSDIPLPPEQCDHRHPFAISLDWWILQTECRVNVSDMLRACDLWRGAHPSLTKWCKTHQVGLITFGPKETKVEARPRCNHMTIRICNGEGMDHPDATVTIGRTLARLAFVRADHVVNTFIATEQCISLRNPWSADDMVGWFAAIYGWILERMSGQSIECLVNEAQCPNGGALGTSMSHIGAMYLFDALCESMARATREPEW